MQVLTLHHGKIAVPLKHSRLKLTGERVEKEEQKEQHDSGPSSVGSPKVFSPGEIIGRAHEQGNSNPNDDGHKVIVLRIRLVA